MKSPLARSIAMMSACLVIAQNGRYAGASTKATGVLGAQMSQCGVQTGLVGVRQRVGEHLGPRRRLPAHPSGNLLGHSVDKTTVISYQGERMITRDCAATARGVS